MPPKSRRRWPLVAVAVAGAREGDCLGDGPSLWAIEQRTASDHKHPVWKRASALPDHPIGEPSLFNEWGSIRS